MNDIELHNRLDELVDRYNRPAFADADPVQFPRRYSDARDIEISALLTSTIAWGRRPMILRDAERLHELLGGEPYAFVTGGDIDDIDDRNIHRTFFGRHLRHYLRGLRSLYGHYGSLENLAAAVGADKSEAPAWEIAGALNGIIHQANGGCCPAGGARCLPADIRTTALKRFNMALRWLVRHDGIVDIGVWSVLKPSQLYLPLDVHSGNMSRSLGLLARTANDRRAVVEVTERLRRFRPDDPTVYDFALFGVGVEGYS